MTATTLVEDVSPQELKTSLRGELLLPSDAGYDEARKVFNGAIDKHPRMIARCAGTADVITAVRFARKHNLLVSIRGSGHNVAGNAICDNGLVIDLSRMKGIRVDPETKTARAQPGVTWGEFDFETQAFGLATTGGLVSTTGIAGFTLGGGIGWLVRKHGTACDNLLSVDLVTSDGQLVTASPRENPDLFWGVRGGGGNFGIVTSFEYQLHPVGPLIIGGVIIHPVAKATDLLRFYREFVAEAPEELTTLVAFLMAPPLPFVPQQLHGRPVVIVAFCYAGDLEKGERVLEPLRTFGPPAVALVQPMPYRVLQSFLDADAQPALQNYWKSDYLRELSDDAINTILSYNGRAESPLTEVHLHHMQGAFTNANTNDTAFVHPDAPFVINIVSRWTDPREANKHIKWARDFFAAMRPFAAGQAYLNFLGEEGEERVKAAYGGNYERLAALKKKYDPTNFFRLNQNIKPSAK